MIDTSQILAKPSTKHLFGTDTAARDTFSRTLFGIRTSARVGIFVGILSTLIGTIIGGLAGFYGGWIDNLLMRMTDLFLTLPLLAVLLTAAKFLNSSTPTTLAILIACLIWTSIARIVRGVFLSLREKEYVEAARAAGAGDLRIMLRHMVPNTVGPDRRRRDADDRHRDRARSDAVVPRLRHPAADPGARRAARRRPVRGCRQVVARHLPRAF